MDLLIITLGGFVFVTVLVGLITSILNEAKSIAKSDSAADPHNYVLNGSLLSPGELAFLKHEFDVANSLNHRNIIKIIEFNKTADTPFLVLELFSELNLKQAIRRGPDMIAHLLDKILIQTVEALYYFHSKGYVHCDIKPENMILLPDGRLQLADFGIAKVAQKTINGSGSGTVGYMAPEQAMGRPSTKSDVFSLGLIMYRMFTGHLPVWPFEWPFVGAANLRRKAHPDLITVVRRSIEVRPGKRFADRLEGLATHQHRLANRHPLEAPEVARNMPGQPIVHTDHAIFGGRDHRPGGAADGAER